VSSVFWMMSLQFASISFPSQVLTIDERNSFICIIRGDMMMMSIESLSWNSVSVGHFYFLINLNIWISLASNLSKIHDIWIKLQIGRISRFFRSCFISSHNFVLSSDNSNFDSIRISFNLNSFLHIIVSILLAEEALDFMFIKRSWFICFRPHFLNKSDHCFVTLRVKLIVISSFELQELVSSILSWIFRNLWFNWIFKIGDESQTII